MKSSPYGSWSGYRRAAKEFTKSNKSYDWIKLEKIP